MVQWRQNQQVAALNSYVQAMLAQPMDVEVLNNVAEALNATVFGLSIAVPTLVAFSYFSKRVEVMSVEMETLVVELIGKCYFGRTDSVPGRVTPVPAPAMARTPAPLG